MKEYPEGSAPAVMVIPPSTTSLGDEGSDIVVVPAMITELSREIVMVPMTVTSPASSSEASSPKSKVVSPTTTMDAIGICVTPSSGIVLVPPMTTLEAESSSEMGIPLTVVTSPGSSSVAIWPTSMVVPPITTGAGRGAGVDGGIPTVRVPSMTTNVAEVSNEIGMSLIVVCCPGVIALTTPLTKMAECDGSITTGPIPGRVVVRISSGIEVVLVVGGLAGEVGNALGGSPGPLDDLCTGSPAVGSGRPGEVS